MFSGNRLIVAVIIGPPVMAAIRQSDYWQVQH
jgi:hypothetical protein